MAFSPIGYGRKLGDKCGVGCTETETVMCQICANCVPEHRDATKSKTL
jgi:hypothetical protein